MVASSVDKGPLTRHAALRLFCKKFCKCAIAKHLGYYTSTLPPRDSPARKYPVKTLNMSKTCIHNGVHKSSVYSDEKLQSC
jgi:hypothetical protein